MHGGGADAAAAQERQAPVGIGAIAERANLHIYMVWIAALSARGRWLRLPAVRLLA